MWAAFGFHFPVTFICGTFSLNWVLSAGLRRSLRAARLAAAPAGRPPALPAAPSQRKVVTIGVCTAFEIAASNLSLLTLSVSFHTMIKSSTPLFVLIAAIALGLEQPTRLLIASMMLVTGGVMLCSAGEIKFDWGGFMYILTASMAGGVRWSLAQLLLQREGGAEASAVGARDNISDVLLHNLEKCVELLYHQLPVSVAALIPAWLLLERVRFLLWIAAQEESSGMLALKLGLVISGCALLAFVLIVTELSLLTLTSSVTLSVAAIAKELLLIAAAVVILGEAPTGTSSLGFFIALSGVSLYKYIKIRAVLGASTGEQDAEQQPLLTSGSPRSPKPEPP